MSLRSRLLLLLLLAPVCGCRQARPPDHSASPPGGAQFVDIAKQAGLDYRWVVTDKRPLNILDTIGNGCAFLDYDGDGDLDVLLVGTDRVALYKGDGRGHFADVSHQAGLDALRGHFLGVAVGDYDNDGWDDLYVSGYRTGLLLHNEPGGQGGRRFRDVTGRAGLASQPWGTSCAWGDIDGSGRLSLYVADYAEFGPDSPQRCDHNGHLTVCAPAFYPPLKGVLYRNMGGGRFADVTATWGAQRISGRTLGVAFADFDDSGRQSLILGNDMLPTDLLKNVGGRFVNVGVSSGTAYNAAGSPYAGMGMDWGDYDNDGRPDLAVDTFEMDTKPVYHNEGKDLFEDRALPLGLAGNTTYVAFGVKWLDYDNSGWLSLLMTNGHISDNVAEYENGRAYRQPLQLFHNEPDGRGGRRFEDVSERAGLGIMPRLVGRGLAVGDFENNGRLGALVADAEGVPLLLRNEGVPVGHWLELELEGTKSNRDGYGTAVTAVAGGLTQTRVCHADGSYLSSSDRRVHLGLGGAGRIDALTVRWPDGHTDRLRDVLADRILHLTEGAAPVTKK